MLYKTSSGLQVVRVALPPPQCLARRVAFQLKLLLKVNYLETIQNARKLLPLFQQVDTPTVAVSQVQPRSGEEYLRYIEALQQASQQLASLSVCRDDKVDSWCFKCGQPGHLAKNCKPSPMSQIECFNIDRKDIHQKTVGTS